MGVFHVFYIVQIVPNCATHHISVRISDINYGPNKTIFLNLITLEGSTASSAKHLFNSVDIKLVENDILCQMVSAIGVDNANTNIGTHNSINTTALVKNKEIVIAGCPHHILHSEAGKAADDFAEVSGLNVECHFADDFCWSDKSSKGKSVLKEH